MKKKQIEFFDNWSKKYLLNKVPQYLELVEQYFEAIQNHCSFSTIKDATDLGTGTGILALTGAQKFQNLKRMTAVDVSRSMLDIVEQNWIQNGLPPNRLKTLELDFQSLNFDTNSMDIIMASFSMHHIPHKNKQKVMNRLFECIKPGGCLALGETMFDSRSSKFSIAKIYINKAWNGLRNIGWAQCWREIDFYFKIINQEGEFMISKPQWEEIIQNAGFKIAESKFTNENLTYGYIIAKKPQ